jgi:riboflavin synthase
VFTGIIEELGSVAAVEPLTAGRRLTIRSAVPASDISLGESVALNGACMTVVEARDDTFAVDVSAESLRRTTLGELVEGARVNVERSMRLSDRIGGHLVSGHVDATGTVREVREEGESWIFTFDVPDQVAALLVEKGSVAVDGISLTCFNCCGDRFDVAVIPHTYRVTTLGQRRPGSRVNVENDVLGKYVAKLVEPVLAKYGA